ncbi:MAG TPA: hypothetical protein VJP89_22970 [Pyrinomonadaceae bacterium]|nr:hypothetical protein [Pyrinomonadaceae bacterium]
MALLLFHTGLQPGGETLTLPRNRFNGFSANTAKPLKRFSAAAFRCGTGLKPGVNEKDLKQSCSEREIYIALLGRGARLDDSIAEIIERRRVLTTSDELKTAATSGSSTIATVPSDIFALNRFGDDLL